MLRNQVQLLIQVQRYLLNSIKCKRIGGGRCQNQAVCYGQTCPQGTDEKTKDRAQETTEQAKTLENTRATTEILQTHAAETVDLYLL